MSRMRDIKIKARRDLHRHAAIPAIFISRAGATPRLVKVRLHTKNKLLGELQGDQDYGARQEIMPRIVVMRDKIRAPKPGAIFIIARGEAYRVAQCLPPDLLTITAECTQIPVREADGLPYPSGSEIPVDPEGGDDNGEIVPIEPGETVVIPVNQPLTIWRLEHNLNRYPDVNTVDSAGDEFEGDVRYISRNVVEVSFNAPVSGFAYLN